MYAALSASTLAFFILFSAPADAQRSVAPLPPPVAENADTPPERVADRNESENEPKSENEPMGENAAATEAAADTGAEPSEQAAAPDNLTPGESPAPIEPVRPEPESVAPTAPPTSDAPSSAAPSTEPVPAMTDGPAEPPPVKANPRTSQPKLDNATEQGAKMANGSIDVCETLTAPIGLIPTVGSVIGLVLDWACLIPGAMAMDYTQTYHGDTKSFVWQATIALVFAKLWRDFTRWPVVIGISIAAIGAVALVIATAVGAAFIPQSQGGGVGAILPAYAPVAVTGVLVAAGATYIGMRKVRKWGQQKIFDWTYGMLTGTYASEAEQVEAQEGAWIHPPLNGTERLWALASMAGGSDGERELWFLVPVVGRIGKATAQAEALKLDMRDVAENGLHESVTDEELGAMDTTIDVLQYSEGILGAAADVFLIAGGTAFLGGTVFAGFWLTQAGTTDLQTLAIYGSILGGVGTVGIGLALTGVGLLLLREVPRFLKPILVPIAYGPFPVKGGWFTVDEDKSEASGAAVSPDQEE